jgi:DNA-binding transcriptional MerR regulator
VRTLHLYDQLNLLKPSIRTSVGYRKYGEPELLRLQQILFYRELDFPLKEIGPILDNPNFNLVKALEGHKAALTTRRDRLTTLMHTVDNTITNLKNKTMNNYEQLYEGMPKEQAAAWPQRCHRQMGRRQYPKIGTNAA